MSASPAVVERPLLPASQLETNYPRNCWWVAATRVEVTREPLGRSWGSWPGLTAQKLMEEEVYPVCSPLLHTRVGRAPSDLRRHMLIHDLSMDGREGFPTWEAWLHRAGVAGVDAGRGLKINNSAAVLQAAVEGQGIALARSVMARDDLAAGRLVRLFPNVAYASALAYYVVYRPECSGLPRLKAFRDWLFAEVEAAEASRART